MSPGGMHGRHVSPRMARVRQGDGAGYEQWEKAVAKGGRGLADLVVEGDLGVQGSEDCCDVRLHGVSGGSTTGSAARVLALMLGMADPVALRWIHSRTAGWPR
jgi:hypothetical protein